MFLLCFYLWLSLVVVVVVVAAAVAAAAAMVVLVLVVDQLRFGSSRMISVWPSSFSGLYSYLDHPSFYM